MRLATTARKALTERGSFLAPYLNESCLLARPTVSHSPTEKSFASGTFSLPLSNFHVRLVHRVKATEERTGAASACPVVPPLAPGHSGGSRSLAAVPGPPPWHEETCCPSSVRARVGVLGDLLCRALRRLWLTRGCLFEAVGAAGGSLCLFKV